MLQYKNTPLKTQLPNSALAKNTFLASYYYSNIVAIA
jgi:hypothetical protein